MNSTETKLSRARTALLLDRPWFGVLAMRLQFSPGGDTKTMATDGTRLYYDAGFVEKTPDAQLQAVIAHEVMHCALLHPYRRAGRDQQTWNRATDYAINAELKKAGFQLPPDVIYDPRFAGKSADVIYAELRESQQQQQQQQQQGGDTGNEGDLSTGEVLDAPPSAGASQPGDGAPGKGGQGSGSPRDMEADDWKVAAEQATATSRGAGKDPGTVAHLAKAAQSGRDDWRAVLHEFMTGSAMPSDYSWSTPNRRHVHAGMYLPGVRKESLGRIVVAVDTSGSMRKRDLEEIAGELTTIMRETKPEGLTVIYCDTGITGVSDINVEDDEVTLTANGRGGTLYGPVFEHLAGAEDCPACLIYCTDLDPHDEYPEPPPFPVLWLTPERIEETAPFGCTVRMAAA